MELSSRLLISAALLTFIATAGCSSKSQPQADAQTQTVSTTPTASSSTKPKGEPMTRQVYYLEIVTKDVDGVCAVYAAANGLTFGQPEAGLGNARTAPLPNGGLVGVRAPLRDTETPITRPYWLVDDIEAAVAAVKKAGGTIALPPMKLPGHGTCAIYFQGGVEHGLWQK